MSITEFKEPEWLANTDARTIEKRMMANLPLDIDKTEGGFAWDLTYPTALEKSEMLQYYMVLALKTMFPQWAEGRWLDYHAHDAGLVRKAANHAYGYVTVTGNVGRVIPQGFVFSVPSVDGSAAIDFETLAACSIPDSGSIDIAVQAVEAGTVGNVANDTITIMRSPITGITSITNKEAITGGAEAEDDDSLRQRIDDLLAGRGDSYVGNNADYVRWAKEVPGVGFAHTIPEYNGPNSVKVVIVDANGIPANEQILEAVKLHIFGTNRKDMARLAPIGVIDYAIVAPTAVPITFKFRLKLEDGATVESVKAAYKTALSEYYASIASGNEKVKPVQYIETFAVLAKNTQGVADFEDFLMNGGVSNITFEEDEYPVTGEIEVTTYE